MLVSGTTLAVCHDVMGQSMSPALLQSRWWSDHEGELCIAFRLDYMALFMSSIHLECDSRPHFTNLLLDLSDRTIQIASNSLLLVSAKQEVSLAKITIDTSLDGDVVASVHKMIASTDWRVLGAHVLLQAAEEVYIFSVHEWHEDTQCAL